MLSELKRDLRIAQTAGTQLSEWNENYQDEARRALQLVLEFRSDVHAHRMARIVAASERMLQQRIFPDAFPEELLVSVVRHYVSSQRLHGRIARAGHSLQRFADRTFAWPDGIQEKSRVRLRKLAEEPLLNSAVIELPTHVAFPDNNGRRFTGPRALTGNEHRARYLDLDLELVPVNYLRHQRDVSRVDDRSKELRRGMKAITRQFPNLSTCVLSIRLLGDDNGIVALPADKTTPIPIFSQDIASLRPSIFPLINRFEQHGPGDLELVHFSYQTPSRACAGPLMGLDYAKPGRRRRLRLPTNAARFFAHWLTSCREFDVRGGAEG